MKILRIDEKAAELEFVPQTLDDLWHLQHVLEKGDVVSALTERKLKPKVEGQQPIRVKLRLEIELDEISFDKFTGTMRLSGYIVGGKPEDLVELKAHHSIGVDLGEKLFVKKKQFKNYQISRLKKAEKSTKKGKIALVVLDDGNATIAVLADYGYSVKAEIASQGTGKRFKQEKSNSYFEEIIDKLESIGMEQVVIAGPGFAKEALHKQAVEKLPKFFFAVEALNSIGVTGLNELVKKGLGLKAVEEMEIAKEAVLVEKVFEEIGKNSGLIAYGLKEVKQALDYSAIETLLVSESLLVKERDSIEKIMELAEKGRAKINIVSSENEPGKKLDGISGIAALLRFKIS